MRRQILALASTAALLGAFIVASPARAAASTDFDGVYEASGNVLTTTCTGEATITNTAVLPTWYFVVKDGLIDGGLLGQIADASGSATMVLSSSKLGGVTGVEMSGPVIFAIQPDGTVRVGGTLTNQPSPACTQTLQLTGALAEAFTFDVRASYSAPRGKAVSYSLCDPRQKTKCGWPGKPRNPHSTDPRASFSFSVAHFSFSSSECAAFGSRCGFLPRGLKLNLFTGMITGAAASTLKPGRYPVRLCATEFSSGKRVCRGTEFIVR